MHVVENEKRKRLWIEYICEKVKRESNALQLYTEKIRQKIEKVWSEMDRKVLIYDNLTVPLNLFISNKCSIFCLFKKNVFTMHT